MNKLASLFLALSIFTSTPVMSATDYTYPATAKISPKERVIYTRYSIAVANNALCWTVTDNKKFEDRALELFKALRSHATKRGNANKIIIRSIHHAAFKFVFEKGVVVFFKDKKTIIAVPPNESSCNEALKDEAPLPELTGGI